MPAPGGGIAFFSVRRMRSCRPFSCGQPGLLRPGWCRASTTRRQSSINRAEREGTVEGHSIVDSDCLWKAEIPERGGGVDADGQRDRPVKNGMNVRDHRRLDLMAPSPFVDLARSGKARAQARIVTSPPWLNGSDFSAGSTAIARTRLRSPPQALSAPTFHSSCRRRDSERTGQYRPCVRNGDAWLFCHSPYCSDECCPLGICFFDQWKHGFNAV